jgi:hypothetical protein
VQAGILSSLQAAARQHLWNYEAAHAGRVLDSFTSDKHLRDAAEQGLVDVEKFLYSTLGLLGGITLLAPDKTIDYRRTPDSAKYAFTFWAFPRSQWLSTLRAYLDQEHRLPLQYAAWRLLHSPGSELAAVLHARGRNFLH